MGERAEPRGRLELTWSNKHRTLLTRADGTYEWVDPADRRVSEVRLFHDVATVGTVCSRRAEDNLLIRGDALHALQALNLIPEFAKTYVGKIRLVYIDPPFNTEQLFPQYDDNLEHSVWLTMLRDRLTQIKPLLAPNASVWVHLDDAEQHRARQVMDEVLGTSSYVSTVVWENFYGRSNAAAISPAHNYIHVYSPMGKEKWRHERHLLPRAGQALTKYSNPDNDPRGPWRSGPIFAPEERHDGLMYQITTPSGKTVTPPKGSHWRMTEPDFHAMVEDGRVIFGTTGDGAPAVKLFLDEVQDGLVPRSWWPHQDVGHSQEAKREIAALFPGVVPFATPKPEKLMQRIIHIATDPGEIVLDCFAGSGTTAAVAHKLGRRWITVESSAETVASFTLPRLQKVVAGEDPGGISTVKVSTGEGLPDGLSPGASRAAASTLEAFVEAKMLTDLPGLTADGIDELVDLLRSAERTTTEQLWSGGGGFRVLDVGPSMFQEVDGRVYLAEWATNGALGEATAAQLGYEFETDPPFCGRKGKVRLAVVDGLVNEGVVRLLVDSLPPGQRLCVCGTAIDPDVRPLLRELRPGSTLKKVPSALLDEYRVPRRERLALANLLDWSSALELVDVEVSEPVSS